MKGALGKVLYGALFVVVLPAALVAWARATEALVRVPLPASPQLGAATAGVGASLVLAGWHGLYRHGGGLPMNAFPPPRHVAQGVYALFSHPIYMGGCAVAFGVSLMTRSSSGFWLVSPALVLACAALVLGYEGPDLAARFGQDRPRPWISLPPDDPSPPTLAERLSLYPMVILLWIAVYEAIAGAGLPPGAISTRLPLDDRIPILEHTEAIYALAYPLVLSAPLAARTRRDLRALALRGILAMALIFPLYLALPLISPEPPFTPRGPLGHLLALERAWDTPAAAFPSFHVVWAFLAADAWGSRSPRIRIAARALAWNIAASCLTTGMHSILDVLAGLLATLAIAHHARVWAALRALAERVANSWREWRIGPVRIINHGGWAALSTFGGLALVGTLIGPGHTLSMLLAATAGLVCSALWAQIIEGSPSLLRPYGWYGGVLGVSLGAIAAPLTGTGAWLLLAAFCAAAPWTQSVGRLRCLVQGCCHGRPSDEATGIRYVHPRSRVCRLSDLGGRPVHPTPLYSILWNVAIALVLGRLWSLGARLPFLAGIYLAMGGLGRFVEEAYRGEPQTPVHAGLRFYQWMAIASLVAGALMTTVHGDPAPLPHPSGASIAVAALFGTLSGFAAGADFPDSNRRLARLV